MTFNVKEEVAKRHFFLKNILENSIGDEELEINRINYNILSHLQIQIQPSN